MLGMQYIAFTYKGKIKVLELDTFVDKYGKESLNNVPYAVGRTEEEAINFYGKKRDSMIYGYSNCYVGHCEKCGKPIFKSSYVSFKPTIFGTRCQKVTVNPSQWYFHKDCFNWLTEKFGISKKLIAYIRTSPGRKILDRIPSMALTKSQLPGTRVYKNSKGDFFVRYTIDTKEVEFYTRGTYSQKEFDKINTLVKLISKEVRVF
jgi:hypothetical protein